MTTRTGPVPVLLVDDNNTTILDEANTSVRVTIVSGGASGGTSATDDDAFTAGSGSGTPAMGFFSADTVDAGDVGVLAMDASRRLLVSIEADNVGIGGGTQYTEDAAAAANPVGNALIMVRDDALSAQTTTDGDNVAARGTDKGELYVKHADTVVVSGTVTAELSATDNAVLDTIDAVLDTINAKLVTGTVIGDVNLGAVDNAVLDAIAASVTLLDNAISGSEMQVDVVGALPAGTNLIGDVGIQPRTTNGLTTFMASGSDGSSILVATAQVIKASAGKLYGYYAYNPEAAVTFVHFYNTAAASVTVGTTNPLFTLAIPAGAAANLMSEIGITFSNAGWSCAATTTAGGNTAPATGVSLVAWYA